MCIDWVKVVLCRFQKSITFIVFPKKYHWPFPKHVLVRIERNYTSLKKLWKWDFWNCSFSFYKLFINSWTLLFDKISLKSLKFIQSNSNVKNKKHYTLFQKSTHGSQKERNFMRLLNYAVIWIWKVFVLYSLPGYKAKLVIENLVLFTIC